MDLGVKLVSDYLDWYRENTIIKNIKESVELTTPVVNHINDRIRIYITPKNDGFLLSDDGATLNELDLEGINLTTETRQKMVKSILNFHGIRLDEDVLYITTSQQDFPKKKHQLVQAILKIYDLLLTKRENILNLFNEEVQDYLYDHDFGGTPNIKMTGQSGIDYSVDYSIGATKNRPEMLIQFANKLTFNSITTYDFMFDDVRGMRQSEETQTKFIIIANDKENKISSKALKAADAHGVSVIPWSTKEKILSLKELKK